MRFWLPAAKVGVTLLLVGVLLWSVDWRDSVQRLADLASMWTVAALLVMPLSIAISAWKWQLLLRAGGIRVALTRLIRLYWIGTFFNNLMPTNVGGDVVRVALARWLADTAAIAASVLVERATGFFVLTLLALAALLLGPALDQTEELRAAASVAFVVGALLLALLLWRGHALIALVSAFQWPRSSFAGRLREKLYTLTATLRTYGTDGRALLVTCGVSVIFYASLMVFHYTVIRSVGGHVALLQVALAAPLIALISALPVSFNGIGIAEAAFVVLYAQAGLAPEVALAAAIVRRVVLIVVSMLGAVFWLAERRPQGGLEHRAQT